MVKRNKKVIQTVLERMALSEFDGEELEDVIIKLNNICRNYEHKYDSITFDYDYNYERIDIVGSIVETNEEFNKRCEKLDKALERKKKK